MRLFSVACGAAALLLTAAVLPAEAAVHRITYKGTVGYSVNLTNMFGPGSYDTLAYKLVYTIDDLAAGAVHLDGPNLAQISGVGVNSPVHAAITINNITWQINGASDGYARQSDQNHGAGGADYVEQRSRETNITASTYHQYEAQTWISTYGVDFLAAAPFGSAYNYNPLAGGGGYFNYLQFNDALFNPGGGTTQINYASLNLFIDSVAVTTASGPSAAPEPTTWGLMLLGFGGMGAELRRRQGLARTPA